MTSWEKESNNFIYVLGILLFVLLLVGIGAWFYMNEKPINTKTLCLQNPSEKQTTYAFLIDTTDSFSTRQQEKLRKKIQSAVNASQNYDRFQIYVISSTSQERMTPIFDYCKPADDYMNPPIQTALGKKKFQSGLESAFQLSFGNSASPIIDSIDLVATRLPADVTEKVFIIVSDFYENSSILNHYKPNWREYVASNSRKLSSKAPSLFGVNVHLWVIARENLDQGQEFIQWWINFMEDSGASIGVRSFPSDSGHEFELVIAERITG